MAGWRLFPSDLPPDINPTNDFLLVLIFWVVILSPVLLVFLYFGRCQPSGKRGKNDD